MSHLDRKLRAASSSPLRNRHGRSRVRRARCSGSRQAIARSWPVPPRAAHPRTAPSHDRRGTRNHTVMRGEAIHQRRDLVLLSNAAGAADHAVWVRGTGDDKSVAWPCGQMCVHSGDRGVGPTREKKVEERDVTGLALRKTGGRGPWLLSGSPGRPRHCLLSSALGPCGRGPGQNRGRRRWLDHRPRLRRGRRSAPDRGLNVRVPRSSGRSG